MRLFKLLPALVILLSCSVKENRAGCPCHLLVYADDSLCGEVSACIYDTPHKLNEQVIAADENGMECIVPRKELRVTYIKMPAKMPRDNEMYKIPFGSECDSLYAYSHLVDCSEEIVIDTLKLNKNFASLFGHFVGGNCGGIPVVSGNVCGISIPELQLVEGAFRVQTSVGANGMFTMRLPRQKDSSLYLEIYDSAGALIWAYPLGENILDIGYDWAAPSLSDIVLEIDASSLEICLKIIPWNDTEPLDETI